MIRQLRPGLIHWGKRCAELRVRSAACCCTGRRSTVYPDLQNSDSRSQFSAVFVYSPPPMLASGLQTPAGLSHERADTEGGTGRLSEKGSCWPG